VNFAPNVAVGADDMRAFQQVCTKSKYTAFKDVAFKMVDFCAVNTRRFSSSLAQVPQNKILLFAVAQLVGSAFAM